MKKKFTLVLSALMMAGLAWDYNHNLAHTNSAMAPPGNTGSPSDGQTCARSGCHVGGPSQTSESVELTSNIPSSGYVAGTTYQMTVTMTNAGGQRFGFQLSPQDNIGDVVGTLIEGSGTRVNGNMAYVTHFNTSTGSGSRSWDFEWTAPSGGAGTVTFYGAFNFANANGSANGDVIVSETFSFNEANVGISEAELASIQVYPNPVIDEVHVAAKDVDEEIMISMFSIDGKKVLEEIHDGGDIKIDLQSKNLNTGVYFLQIEVDGISTIKKLLVK